MKKWENPSIINLNYRSTKNIQPYAFRHQFICDCCGEEYPVRSDLEAVYEDARNHKCPNGFVCKS